MLYSAVFRREPHDGISINLVPLWSIKAIRDGYIETLYEKIYNVLFFVPYGALIGLWFRTPSEGGTHEDRAYSFWNSLKKSTVIGFMTSACIEIIQLITRTGTCEIDDVICNTVGCVVGAIIGITLWRPCHILSRQDR